MTGNKRSDTGTWSWPARDELVAKVVKEITAARPATLVVTGPLGSGKSYVLDAVTKQTASRFGSTQRITGRSKHQRFAALLPHLPLDATPAATEWQLAHQLRQTLVPFGLDLPTLLVVDDLDLVDEDSLSVIVALVETDGCILLAASETDSDAAGLPRSSLVSLAPMDPTDVGRVIRQLVGPTDALTERSLVAASGGNPLILSELLTHAAEHRSFSVVDGLWSADQDALQPRSVEAALRKRRGSLSPEANQLLSLLAFSDVVPQLGLPRAALQELRDHGWVNAGDATLRLSPRVISSTGDDELSHLGVLALKLVGAEVDQVPASDLVRWKRLARVPITDGELVAASRHAAQKWAIADALAFMAEVRDASQEVILLCAELSARNGDLDRAAELHDEAIAMAADDQERVSALRSMADFHFFRRQRPDMALQAVTDVAAEVTDPTAAVALQASIVMYAEMADDRSTSTTSRQRVVDIGDVAAPLARADFTANVSFFDVMRGRLQLNPTWADAVAAVDAIEPAALLPAHRSLRLRLQLTEHLRRAAFGDLRGARALSSEELARIPDGGPGIGVWLVTLADCDRMAGDLHAARRHLVSARRYLATDDDLGIGEIAQADLAGVLMEAGDHERATVVFNEIGSDPAVFDPRSMGRTARTEVRLAAPETCDQTAYELASLTREFGFVSWAAEVLYEAIRRGPSPKSTELLQTLSAELTSGLLIDMLAFGKATLNEDISGLCVTARKLFDREASNFGADAVGHAFMAAGARSKLVPPELVAMARDRSRNTVRTQVLLDEAGAAIVDLTQREHEIAVLAAQGLTSKDIATTLRITTRTVDNHLGAIYRKMGVTSRSGLASIFQRRPS